jgi:hypothetical protein
MRAALNSECNRGNLGQEKLASSASEGEEDGMCVGLNGCGTCASVYVGGGGGAELSWRGGHCSPERPALRQHLLLQPLRVRRCDVPVAGVQGCLAVQATPTTMLAQ